MDYFTKTAEVNKMVVPVSRLQEKEELRRLNNQFSTYGDHIRQLDQPVKMDMSAVLSSRQIHAENTASLKNIYESEVENLRKVIEVGITERNFLQAKCINQQKSVENLRDKLSLEADKNNKLFNENSILQRRIEDLLSKLQCTQNTMQQPQENLDLLQMHAINLTREVELWKHKCEREQLATQELEEQLQQTLKKLQFSDEVHEQQIKYYKARFDLASATFLNAEPPAQTLITTNVPVSKSLKQEHNEVNTCLRNYETEAKEMYARNLSTAGAKTDSNTDTLQKVCLDKAEMAGTIGELTAKIRNFEEQVASLQYQNKLLEDALIAERSKASDTIQQLNMKFRDMQDMLVAEIKEMISENDSSSSVRAEFQAFKVLLEEEERRLQAPMDIVSSLTSVSNAMTSGQILTTSTDVVPDKASSNYIPITGSSINKISADSKPVDVSDGPMNTSQLITSLPEVTSDTFMTTDDYSSSYPNTSGIMHSLYSLEPLSPLNTFYIPQELRSTEKNTITRDAGLTTSGLSLPEIFLPMTGPQYNYNTSYDSIHPHAIPSPSQTSRAVGPIHARSKSAPVKTHKPGTENQRVEESCSKENEINFDRRDSELTQMYDVPKEILQDFKTVPITKSKPNSSPLDRLLSSNLAGPDSTSNAIGDLKIVEVDKNGKFVKLLNDGPTDFELGGYIIQQIVSGSPVALFRFPPHTKFVSDSTVTVWSAVNDPSVHNPPTDFFCKELQKWKSAPNCTTLLCQANGEAVAWTKAAHRFSKDAFIEDSKVQQDSADAEVDQEVEDEAKDNDILTELKMDFSRSKTEPVYLRREKKQPPSLTPSKHPHGSNPAANIHPHTGQPRPLCFGNDNSTYSRQSRTQTIRPDPIPGQPYTGAPAQRLSSKSSRTMGSSQGIHSSAITENMNINKKPVTALGDACEGPSPFMSHRSKLSTGLQQVCSQHHPDFLPPMPRTLQTSW